MFQKFRTLLLFVITIFLAACGDTKSNNSSPTSNKISFSGTASGYIKDADLCLDLNINGVCDANEPSTKTKADGSFSFKDVEIKKDGYFPLLLSGGTDTSTNKLLNDELKKIVFSKSINSSKDIYITPITDLLASSYLASITSKKDRFKLSETQIANSFDLDVKELEKDYLKNKKLFVKTLELEVIKRLLLTSVLKRAKSTSSKKLLEKIKLSIISSIKNSNTNFDALKIIDALATIDSSIIIPQNEKEFIQKQNEILQNILSEITKVSSNLVKTKSGFEDIVELALKKLNDAKDNESIALINNNDSDVDLETPPSPPTL